LSTQRQTALGMSRRMASLQASNRAPATATGRCR
jgi:hypothetical protein